MHYRINFESSKKSTILEIVKNEKAEIKHHNRFFKGSSKHFQL